MAQREHPSDHPQRSRHDRLLQELEHDPYHSKRKIKGPARCPDCGAVYTAGRWAWGTAANRAVEHQCPACHRVVDRVPAAFLTVRGQFARDHADEIRHLIRNYETRERAEHPLKRLMEEYPEDDGTVFTFTDAHLARGIGEALYRAYKGELDYEHQKGEVLLRVLWSR